MDFRDKDYLGPGFYLVTYQRNQAPQGPFETIKILATRCRLTDYPSNGYVAWWDAEGHHLVPSLNPDDLVK